MALKSSKILAIFIITVVITVASLSVSGILQSTERISSSGIIIESAPAPSPPVFRTPSPPPPEPEVKIDVYQDQECTSVLSSIEWGEIEAGASKNVQIFLKNNGDTNVLLGLSSQNWTPEDSPNYMTLSWDYDGVELTPEEVRRIVMTLDVDSDSPAMNSFGFDIVLIGS